MVYRVRDKIMKHRTMGSIKLGLIFAASNLQRAPTSGAMLPQNWLQQPGGGSGIQSNQTLQACQQKLRLQSLQMERERLKQRQQEIARQVTILSHLFYFVLFFLFLSFLSQPLLSAI